MMPETAASTLQALLACPACRGLLEWEADRITCAGCRNIYPVQDGIPVMARPDTADAHKSRQAGYFDEHEDTEFEATRPHGTPGLYQWLLQEKFRRSVAGLGPGDGATVLTVCGGSGMDAEFLAGNGFTVVASDLSLGAARRAKERARRFGVEFAVVVADVEHLPFGDRSIDFSYVHDGLHHLTDPLTGVAEMARVAGRGISINEPARAAATAAAVKVGLSVDVEEAGNRVERLRLDQVRRALEERGFRVTTAERYAMLYRHEPGTLMRILSLPVAFGLTTAGWRLLNRAIGRFGNKLSVQAMR